MNSFGWTMGILLTISLIVSFLSANVAFALITMAGFICLILVGYFVKLKR